MTIHKKRRLPRSRRKLNFGAWQLFWLWVKVVTILFFLIASVKIGFGFKLMKTWFADPIVNVVSFNNRGGVILSINNQSKKTYLYYWQEPIKWQDANIRDTYLSLSEIELSQKLGLQEYQRLIKLFEYNLAVPVKGVIIQSNDRGCQLASRKCLIKNYLPVRLFDKPASSFSWRYFWWLRLNYSRQISKIIPLVKNDDNQLLISKWDAGWQSRLNYNLSQPTAALFYNITDKETLSWYRRAIKNMGWQIVQKQFFESQIDNNNLRNDQNYCLQPTGNNNFDWLLVFFRCLDYHQVSRANLADLRADFAIIIQTLFY